jgi:hypothetical protein
MLILIHNWGYVFFYQGKTKHTEYGRIKRCSLNQLNLLQLAFRDKVIPIDYPDHLKFYKTKNVEQVTLCQI